MNPYEKVTVMLIEFPDGMTWAGECPCCNIYPGMLAECGDMTGVIKAAVTLRRNTPEYAFVQALLPEPIAVSRVSIPCWEAMPCAGK